jgi:hypothetical protein
MVRPSVRVRTAAERLDMDESQVRKLVKAGDLEGHLIGKRGVRVYVDSIEAYQLSRPIGGNPAPQAQPEPRRKRRVSAAHREAITYLRRLGLLSKGSD